MKKLSAHGHLACIVGGCVRDMLLGVMPNDWDIATSALPEEVLSLYPDSLTMGLKHGTVTVKEGKNLVEVTTFRMDGNYADHRHPDDVSFVGDLTTDLSRRDFTINAMAVTHDGTIVDPFGGRDDLSKKIIRAVGEPDRRFEEDALRMFRAFRFSSRLNFAIDDETYRAIERNAQLSSSLASERVRDEVEKTLMTDHPEYLYDLIDCGLMDKYLSSKLSRSDALKLIASMNKKTTERWTAFCYVLLCDGCISSPRDFLAQLRLDGRTVHCCENACELLKSAPPATSVEWKQLLRRFGVSSVECASACMDSFYAEGHSAFLKKVLRSGECFSVKHLAVNGNDLASLGLKGLEIGNMLDFLLDYVIEFPENNKKDLLMSLASSQTED